MLISFSMKFLRPAFYRTFTTTKYVSPVNLIKKLREDTGSPINECKIALETHQGDLEKAKEHLKAKGLAQASKRLSKAAGQGVIGVSISEDRRFSVLAEINCETDFVARTDLFKNFVSSLLQTVVKKQVNLNFVDVSDETKTQDGIINFLSQSQLILEKSLFPEDTTVHNLSILDTQKLIISKLQENVRIRRILTVTPNTGLLGSYVHNVSVENIGTSACVLNLDATLPEKSDLMKNLGETADNLAMQILGTKPLYLYRNDVPNQILEEEKNKIRIEMEKTLKGKPDKIVETIIEGKLKKFYEDNVMMDMEYILDGDGGSKVQEYISKMEKTIGKQLLLKQYQLWSLGQK